MPITVVYFHRKPSPTLFSLERVFADVRAHLPEDIRPVVANCPRESKGILNRVINMLWARRHQGDLNHITGDVHYLTYLMRKDRTILTIHDCVSLERSRGLKHLLLWFLWYWFPGKRCAKITVVSEYTKSQLLRLITCAPGKIAVIHNPYCVRLKPSPGRFNADCPVILQIGTGWNKNLERVAVVLKGIRCRLVVVGGLDEDQRRCLLENGIQYTQHQGISDEKLLSLYEECDLVIFASLYEGFGLPIIEAQATGRPVVTSNRCSMPEVAGNAADLVDPESAESIRAGILRVLRDKTNREALVQKGLENVLRFEPGYIAAQYAELYREIARHQPRL